MGLGSGGNHTRKGGLSPNPAPFARNKAIYTLGYKDSNLD